MKQSQKEKHLNALYADMFSEEQAVEHFCYLTNKTRGHATTEANIRKHHRNHTLGSLLRRMDPIAFNTAEFN